MVKKLPAMQETQGGSPGWEDPLEEEMIPTPTLLPGESHGQRSLVVYNLLGPKEMDTTEQLTLPLSEKCILRHPQTPQLVNLIGAYCFPPVSSSIKLE